jgi:phage terminase large subunit-like protein
VWIENKTYGLNLLQAGRRKGMKFRELDADTDKVSRALEGSGLLVAGRWGLVRSGAWVPDFLHEMAAFPTGRHDDMVDAWSYACRLVEKLSTAGVRGVGLKPGEAAGTGVQSHVDRVFGVKGKRVKHTVLGGWRL